MKNVKLGREILDVADFESERFDMKTWGRPMPCGTVACLAGHALLLSGYTLENYEIFRSPNGERVQWIAHEAAVVLGMTWEERDGPSVFTDMTDGLERFRQMVERSEKEPGA